MRYAYFGNGNLASKLIKSFSDLRVGDVLYNSPDEDNDGRLGIQVNEVVGFNLNINIIKKDEIINRDISREQLEKIIW